MGLVDVTLDPATEGQPLTLKICGASGSNAEFRVELWKLIDARPGTKPQRIPAQAMTPRTLTSVTERGHLFYTVPAIDTADCSRLVMIITRIHANDSLSPGCVVVLHPGADGGGAPTSDGVEAE